MQYYTVTADSYEAAVRKASELYGSGIRIHSRRDYTTGGHLFKRKKQRCEIVCYLAEPTKDDENGKSREKDISEFAAEAKTPDPSTLTRSERLDTEIYRENGNLEKAKELLSLNHITGKLEEKLLKDFPSSGDVSMLLSGRILESVTVDYERQVHPKHFVVFVGPTGSGKTTTLAKAAYLYSKEEKSVGIITLDTYRTGAIDQMEAFGKALSIPVLSAGAEDELIRAAERFSWKDIVLIDTMGLSPKDKELNLKLAGMLSVLDSDRTDYILTVNASMKEEDIMQQYSAYSRFSPSSLAVTKLDETETIGNVLSFSAGLSIPVIFFTDGQRVPEDIAKASGAIVLEHMKGLGLDMQSFRTQVSLS
ncbi:MAG: hypothetical protein IAA97_08400 [Spirochaetes bacterium]|uniref:Flagellar biosynthesis protein FlhF n=1 Tax=Candidatus Ornithospirochaeta stercoripullorum TaxID=2840899 RepID=A0A9D9E0M7_9SPIO|nr:hypothetical protein [Candidatus Ornithospirochaeta stercoripullorum]